MSNAHTGAAMIELTETGWFGVLRAYTITGWPVDDQPVTYYVSRNDTGDIKGRANKSEWRSLQAAVAAMNAAATRPDHQGGDREVILSINSAGRNVGRSWYCTVGDMDRLQLPPSWVGEMICYCYAY